MCTGLATQLGPTEKDNLMRYKCGLCNRIWLSGNNCLARCDGAFLLFVSTSECATCQNFVNSCCQGCERTDLKRNPIRTRRRTRSSMPVSKMSRSLSNRRQRERNCDKRWAKVRFPQWVQVLKERSKPSTRHLGVFWPSDFVERVE